VGWSKVALTALSKHRKRGAAHQEHIFFIGHFNFWPHIYQIFGFIIR